MIRVASYCRVSTDKEDQANSFEAQQRYFRAYIARQPDWELYEIYADEGITGTSTQKRIQFNRMMNDAYAGRFQLILTKEVSRFSRNILDTISYTRELKSMGIRVIFMNDGINTMDEDAELRLSIMASIAQEESRKISSRVKWGQTRQMERGVVFGRSLLGYDVKNGTLSINPEGAEIVRLIFHKYGVEGKGTTVIARELREAGYRTSTGRATWSNSHIVKILQNEKYVGDLIQKKAYTPDYLTHEKKANHGAEERVILRNHHEPIIDRDLWDTVQGELRKRNRHREHEAGHSNRYIFSGKIKCGACGASFVARTKKTKNGSLRRWRCFTVANEGRRRVDVCGNIIGCDIGWILRDDMAFDMLRTALRSLDLDTGAVTNMVTAMAVDAIRSGEDVSREQTEQLRQKIEQVGKKKESMLDAFFAGDITADEMRAMKARYDGEQDALWNCLKAAEVCESPARDDADLYLGIKREILNLLNGQSESVVFYRTLLNHITVFPDRHLELHLNHLTQVFWFSE